MERLPIRLCLSPQFPCPIVHVVGGQESLPFSSSWARMLPAASSLTGLPQIAVFNVQFPEILGLK